MKDYIDRSTPLALDLINSYDPYLAEPETLCTLADLRTFLTQHEVQIVQPLHEHDLTSVHDLRTRLRHVFENRQSGKVVELLNAFLVDTSAKPIVTETFDVTWKVADEQPLLARLSVEAALGLTAVFQTFGPERVKACAATPCQEVFVDTSRNRSRRFCGDRCANRYHVATYREKQSIS